MPNNQPLPEYLAGNSYAYQQALDDFGITKLLELRSHFQTAWQEDLKVYGEEL